MLKSIFKAFTNLFRPVHTVNYPEEDLQLPENYRGLIEYNVEDCTFCDQCEKVCPPGAIIFHQHEDGFKEYHYNPHLCIYCGECVRACPKPDEALWQSAKKQLSALKADEVNNAWFVVEKEAKASRETYAEIKKAERARKAAEKAALKAAEENSEPKE
jgi:NADH-quinone oxidoreductase subunit I